VDESVKIVEENLEEIELPLSDPFGEEEEESKEEMDYVKLIKTSVANLLLLTFKMQVLTLKHESLLSN